MSAMTSQASVTCRPRLPLIVGSWALSLVSAGFALFWGAGVIGVVRGATRGSFVIAAVGAALAAVMMWRQARLSVRAPAEGLTVTNYLGAKRLRWSEIDHFDSSAAYWGIAAILRDGSIVRLNAVQKSNLARWLNEPTRADGITDELNARLREARVWRSS